jgi:hypothetical protein
VYICMTLYTCRPEHYGIIVCSDIESKIVLDAWFEFWFLDAMPGVPVLTQASKTIAPTHPVMTVSCVDLLSQYSMTVKRKPRHLLCGKGLLLNIAYRRRTNHSNVQYSRTPRVSP